MDEYEQENNDLEIYKYILARYNLLVNNEYRDLSHKSDMACFAQLLFKAIPVSSLYLKTILLKFFSPLLVYEFIFLSLVVQFWLTKNYTGPNLLGVRWYYDQDFKGQSRFHYEFITNDEHIRRTNINLFWALQILYIILPIFYIYTIGFTYDLDDLDFVKYALAFGMVVSGTIHSLIFRFAYSRSLSKRRILQNKISTDILVEFGRSTGVSFL